MQRNPLNVFFLFSFEVVGEERLRSRSSCRGNHLGEPGQRLWKVRCLRCPGTQQRDPGIQSRMG